MACSDVDNGVGIARFKLRIASILSDFAMLLSSMAISLALGSFELCNHEETVYDDTSQGKIVDIL